MLITHLFDHNQGSRYHLMINHGLMDHPLVSLNTNDNVVSGGEVIHPKVDNVFTLLPQSDVIFRVGDTHFQSESLDRFMTDYNLWQKTIHYDFSDTPDISYKRYEQCKLYVKRVFEEQAYGKILIVPYCLMSEYMAPIGIERSLDVAYLFNPKPGGHNESKRYEVYQALLDYNFPHSILGVTTLTKGDNGRRAIFDAFTSLNPFWKYLNVLGATKAVWTCAPDHAGGDSRLWEAFGSGALVVTDSSAKRYGFEDEEHCLMYDLDTIDDTVTRMRTMIADGSWAKIAQNGQRFALEHHKPVDRINGILERV